MACYGGIITTIKFSRMKQTSVEWLEEQLKNSKYFYKLMEDINRRSTIEQCNISEQAKQMEKEQMIEIFGDGCLETCYSLYVKDEIFDPKEKGEETYYLTFKYKSK